MSARGGASAPASSSRRTSWPATCTGSVAVSGITRTAPAAPSPRARRAAGPEICSSHPGAPGLVPGSGAVSPHAASATSRSPPRGRARVIHGLGHGQRADGKPGHLPGRQATAQAGGHVGGRGQPGPERRALTISRTRLLHARRLPGHPGPGVATLGVSQQMQQGLGRATVHTLMVPLRSESAGTHRPLWNMCILPRSGPRATCACCPRAWK